MTISFLGYLQENYLAWIFSISLLIIIGLESKRNRVSLISLLHIVAFYIITSISEYLESGFAELAQPTFWRTLFSFIPYVMKPAMVIFAIPILAPRLRKLQKIIIWIPSAIGFLIYQTCFYSSITFLFTEDNHFNRGPLGYTFLVVTIINLVLLIYVFIRASLFKRYTMKEMIIILFIATTILVTAILEIDDILPRNISYSVIMAGCLIYYLSLMVQDERVSALEVKLEVTEKANRSKTVFLNSVSHDIRTPMNAIVGFTNLAKENIDNKDLVVNYLSKISTSSDHLLKLINEVLEMSRIESGKIVLDEKSESLSKIINEIEAINSSELEKKKIHYQTTYGNFTHDYVVCDKLRITQVILNILSNAIKFTPEEGNITCHIEEKSIDDQKANYVISVTDSGIGISKDFQERLFTPFERERSSTVSGIQGSGLGLSITKSIVDIMGGDIQVLSEEGKGSTFIVTLPLLYSEKEKEPEAKSYTKEEYKAMFSGKRLLLVEDNELNQEIAVEILKEGDFQVDIASNGLEALNKVKEQPMYDLILMDIQMPVMDGYEATEAIRSLDDEKKNTPILAVTANAFLEDKKEAYNRGMDGYIPKPINIQDLYQAMEKLIKK